MGRGPEPDDLRAERDRAIVFVVREVMDRGSDRHGFRGFVTARRPFHNLLRRTIAGGRAYTTAGGSPSKPQAAKASSMCDGAGASTSIGGFDFESGTITLRATNCRGRAGRAPKIGQPKNRHPLQSTG